MDKNRNSCIRDDRMSRGFTVLELMIVVTLGAILTAMAMPRLSSMMDGYRRDAAVRQLVGDVRKARMEAIRTGWQYRIYGFNTGATSSYKNQYRLMGRSSGAISWPSDTATPFQSATQMAGRWVDIPNMYRGITLNPGDGTDHFWVSFDSRGVRIESDSFDPMVLRNTPGSTKSVTVGAAGTVRIQ